MFNVAIIAKIWKQSLVNGRKINKNDVVLCRMACYSVLRGKRNISLCDNMDGSWGHYAK